MAGQEMIFDELDMSAFLPVDGNIEDTPEDKEDEGFVPLSQQENNQGTEIPDTTLESGGVGTDDGEDTDKTSEQPDPYSSFAKVLAEVGVLPSLDLSTTKVKSAEDLIEAVKKEIETAKFAGLTDKQKAYLQAIEAGLPEETYIESQKSISMLSNITPEEISSNAELRKQLMLADYQAKGIAPEKALKFVERSIAIGEDESDALESLESLKVLQQTELQQSIVQKEQAKLAQQEKEKTQLLKFKQTIMDTTEIIPGVKINNKVAEKVFEQAVKPVHQLEDGRMVNAIVKAKMDNPIDFEMKLNYLFYMTKGFSDFSKIAVSQKTNAVKDLDDLVKGNTFSPRVSDMKGDLDYTPKEFKGAFDDSIINNII